MADVDFSGVKQHVMSCSFTGPTNFTGLVLNENYINAYIVLIY